MSNKINKLKSNIILVSDEKQKIETETKNEEIIVVNNSEHEELLRKKYLISKTALESVLCFIVPQNLRDLVNKAMNEISELDSDFNNKKIIKNN
jgi:hypothetical protein